MKQLVSATTSFLIGFGILTSSAGAQPPDHLLDKLLPQGELKLELLSMGAAPAPRILHTGEWIVPPETVEHFKMIFLHYLWMPYIFEEYKKRNDQLWRVVVGGAMKASNSRCTEQLVGLQVEQDEGWPMWQVALISGAALAVGTALGIGLGFAAGQQTVVVR